MYAWSNEPSGSKAIDREKLLSFSTFYGRHKDSFLCKCPSRLDICGTKTNIFTFMLLDMVKTSKLVKNVLYFHGYVRSPK